MKKLWKNALPLRANLQKRLPRLASKYFEQGRAAFAPGTSWHDMHQFRLATKRFRYTLEMFQPAYGPGIAKRIEALKHIQTMLGDINDCIVTSGMLQQSPGTEEIRAQLAEKADNKMKKLRSYWLRQFDAAGQEQIWIRYLRTYVCRRRGVRKPSEPPLSADPAVPDVS